MDLEYLLTVKDSSQEKQYKEVITYDESNNIKINENKKVNRPLLSFYKNNNDTDGLNSDEIELLAHLIESEAGNESLAGKIAVGNVVLNRMDKDNKDMKDIIYSKNQFDGVGTENFSIKQSADSLEAARKVLEGLNLVPDAYYFANLNLCDPGFALKEKFIIRIGNHWFFRE